MVVLLAWPDEPETRALRVAYADRVFAPGNLPDLAGQPAAAGLDRAGRAVDVVDADVEVPARAIAAGLGLADRADHAAVVVEEAVFAHRAHVHVAFLLPSEQAGVERDRGLGIAGPELVPAHVLGLGIVEYVALGIGLVGRRDRVHQVEHRALRIGHHRDAPDRQVGRGQVHLAARRGDRLGVGIDVGR